MQGQLHCGVRFVGVAANVVAHIKKWWSALLQCQLHSALRFVAPNDASLVCVVCSWVRTQASMEPGASLVMRVSTLSKLIAWPTRRNASFTTSIVLMCSRRVFLVLARSSMCEGKRTPWSHPCVSASSTKCKTCRCLIQSPTPLKLNIPGLGYRLRHGRRPTAPSEHANSQSSNIVRLLFWTRRKSNFITSCWNSRLKPTFPNRLSADRAFGASSSFAMRKPQKRYLPANFWEAQSWISTRTRWTQVIMQRWRRWHHLV